MLQINLFLTLLCLWLFVYLNNKFLRISRINRVRFQLFALRDRLAVLAMKGEIDQSGDEYKTLRHMVNESIKVLDSFSIVSFLKHIVQISQDKELQKRLSKIISSLEGHGNKDFREIVFQYFKIMRTTFDSHTRFLMKVFLPMIIILVSPIVVWKKMCKQKADSLQAAEQYFEKTASQLVAV
jgi:hypothetical protein